MTTAGQYLTEATQTLTHANIPSARLDCLILMEDSLGHGRATLLAHPELEIPTDQLNKLNKQIARRAKHIPLAYIRGRAPFYGRDFVVDKHVLVPRPETETMIDMLKKLPLTPTPIIADIGTGSGCIGITAALELPQAEVSLHDIDLQALDIAVENTKKHHAKVTCHQGDLLQSAPATIDVVLANLPYVPEHYSINQAAAHEPRLAIFAGKDGLNAYRRFWQQVADLPHKPAFILTESLPPQHESLAELAKDAGYQLTDAQGLIQQFTLS